MFEKCVWILNGIYFSVDGKRIESPNTKYFIGCEIRLVGEACITLTLLYTKLIDQR